MPLRDDLLKPVPGDNPGGANLRYAPVYDQIREARREDDSASLGVWQHQLKAADWPLAIKLASDVLANKSKDLQVAGWLTEALVHREGYAGLCEGLDLLRGLLEGFWDTLWPEIEDGDPELRATPLAWVASQLNTALRRVELNSEGHDWFRYKESLGVPTEEDSKNDDNKGLIRRAAVQDGKLTPEEWNAAFEATPREFYDGKAKEIARSLEAVSALDALCQEKFGDAAPGFRSMREALEEVGNTVRILLLKKGGPLEGPAAEEAEAEEARVEASEPQPLESSTGAAPARAPRPKAAAGPEPENVEDAAARIAAIARWYRAHDPASPVPHLLLRALRWGEVRANPHELDWRMLEAPATEIRQALKRLFLEGDYQELAKQAEEAMAMPCGRAWLDLQRYAVNACESLGCDAIARAIRSETKSLLADFPQLFGAELNDGTQAANPQTREMFAPPPPLALPAPAPEPEPAYEPVGVAAVNGEPAAPDDEELIRAAIRDGRTNDAVDLVSERLAQETTGRSRFQRKTQLAMVCMASGHEAVAFPILRELAAEIAERRLEAWESPAMIAQTLTLYYRCLARAGAPAGERDKVYSDICRLDPKRALELER